jgi:hypothetical protein
MAAYELAEKMQLAAPEVSDLGGEPQPVHDLYGTGDANSLKAAYSRNCLLARRFLERGVRYVSLYCASRASNVDDFLNWDAHKTLRSDYERHCPIVDQPTAALLTDLRQRGMLNDVLVVWCTEFGRMPTHQEGTSGRDHNPDAFTTRMMGAGVKGGGSHCATDDFGRRSLQDVTSVYDFYATVLHLLGLDHERLTYYFSGLQQRLTNVHGHVIQSLLAWGRKGWLRQVCRAGRPRRSPSSAGSGIPCPIFLESAGDWGSPRPCLVQRIRHGAFGNGEVLCHPRRQAGIRRFLRQNPEREGVSWWMIGSALA